MEVMTKMTDQDGDAGEWQQKVVEELRNKDPMEGLKSVFTAEVWAGLSAVHLGQWEHSNHTQDN